MLSKHLYGSCCCMNCADWLMYQTQSKEPSTNSLNFIVSDIMRLCLLEHSQTEGWQQSQKCKQTVCPLFSQRSSHLMNIYRQVSVGNQKDLLLGNLDFKETGDFYLDNVLCIRVFHLHQFYLNILNTCFIWTCKSPIWGPELTGWLTDIILCLSLSLCPPSANSSLGDKACMCK